MEEQIEMTSPREALEKAGAKCVLIAPKSSEVHWPTLQDDRKEDAAEVRV